MNNALINKDDDEEIMSPMTIGFFRWIVFLSVSIGFILGVSTVLILRWILS